MLTHCMCVLLDMAHTGLRGKQKNVKSTKFDLRLVNIREEGFVGGKVYIDDARINRMSPCCKGNLPRVLLHCIFLGQYSHDSAGLEGKESKALLKMSRRIDILCDQHCIMLLM